jgi:hypothetical protein
VELADLAVGADNPAVAHLAQQIMVVLEQSGKVMLAVMVQTAVPVETVMYVLVVAVEQTELGLAPD